MNLNNPTTIAFEILNTIVPSLSPEKFLDALKGYFNPSLSKEENKKIMMQKIREGKLGQALADIAYYKPTSDKNFEDILEEVEEEYNKTTQEVTEKINLEDSSN